MDIISSQVSILAGQNIFLAYLIIYLATIFFGNIGAFTSLWVAFQGGLGQWGVLGVAVAAFLANVTGDCLWYTMGRTLRTTRLGNWIKHRIRNHDDLEERVGKNGKRWMLFGKFVYGSNFPIIFSLGWIKMDFWEFFRRSLLAIAIWLPILLGVSYGLFSSLSLLSAVSIIKRFEVLFLVGLVLALFLEYAIMKVLDFFFKKM